MQIQLARVRATTVWAVFECRRCRQGEHLLTLATPPDCVAYRHWYLAQVADQLEGAQPVSWPEFQRRS